jgi:heme O synthase-like polyprenyltransferase
VVYAFGGFFTKYVDKWARKMFFFSLIINVMWCITIIVGYFIP